MAVNSQPLMKVVARLGTANINFILDTGASISIIPKKLLKDVIIHPSVIKLSTATGESIKCYGEANLDVTLKDLRRTFNWNFVIADVTDPLLGIDFLSNF